MKLYADSVLIGNQWQRDKTITIDAQGIICAIDSGYGADATKLQGALVPGMVNCHSHAFQRAFAGFSEYRANSQDSFWSWRDIMYCFVAKMSPDDLYRVSRFLYLEMLRAGYTSVAEFHYLHHQPDGTAFTDPAEMSHQVINAADSVGIAITHLPVLYSYAGFGEQTANPGQARFINTLDDYWQLVTALKGRYQNLDKVEFGVAPHSLRAVSKNQLDELVPLAKQLGQQTPLHIHIAEQTAEVDDCAAFYGARPVEWLMDNFELQQNWCLIHATHLSAEEIGRLANTGAVVGVCPTTEANLGDGIFAAEEYLSAGGRIAIGSDSHIAINLADEIRSLEYSQRLKLRQRAVLSSPQQTSVGTHLYTHCAEAGASTVNQKVGSIAIGKRADLVLLDSEQPTLYAKPLEFLLDAAIFACDKLPVKSVMVGGQWVLQDGEHLQQEAVKRDYLTVMKKLSS